MDETREPEVEGGGADDEVAPAARILVVDDEEVVHASLKRTLGRRGHQVEAVFSAQEGLARLQDASLASVDLVVSDLMMPEMDGIALLGQLRRRGLDTPVLMITGYPTIRTAMQALRLGAVDYLAKPFTRQELLAPVNRALRRRRQADATVETATARRGDGGDAGGSAGDDGIEAPRVSLVPGDCVRLPRHAWAIYREDGSMEIGIERSFLRSVGEVRSVTAPAEAEIVEQGYVGLRLKNGAGEEHGVIMPVSGPVVAVNDTAVAAPQTIDATVWLLRVIPDRLDRELELLDVSRRR